MTDPENQLLLDECRHAETVSASSADAGQLVHFSLLCHHANSPVLEEVTGSTPLLIAALSTAAGECVRRMECVRSALLLCLQEWETQMELRTGC